MTTQSMVQESAKDKNSDCPCGCKYREEQGEKVRDAWAKNYFHGRNGDPCWVQFPICRFCGGRAMITRKVYK